MKKHPFELESLRIISKIAIAQAENIRQQEFALKISRAAQRNNLVDIIGYLGKKKVAEVTGYKESYLNNLRYKDMPMSAKFQGKLIEYLKQEFGEVSKEWETVAKWWE